jgi:transposase
MIAITTKMCVLIAIEPADFRCRIDGLCRLVRSRLSADPFSGVVFVFRSRAGHDIALLRYDGQGFWLCQKRISQNKFHWPTSSVADARSKALLAHELYTLIWGGDPATGIAAAMWRPVPIEDDAIMLPTYRPPVNAYAARTTFSAAASSSASVSI